MCKFVWLPLYRRLEPVDRKMIGQTPLNYILLYLKSNGCALFSTVIVCSLHVHIVLEFILD